jgi:hypothetical protein
VTKKTEGERAPPNTRESDASVDLPQRCRFFDTPEALAATRPPFAKGSGSVFNKRCAVRVIYLPNRIARPW